MKDRSEMTSHERLVTDHRRSIGLEILSVDGTHSVCLGSFWENL